MGTDRTGLKVTSSRRYAGCVCSSYAGLEREMQKPSVSWLASSESLLVVVNDFVSTSDIRVA